MHAGERHRIPPADRLCHERKPCCTKPCSCSPDVDDGSPTIILFSHSPTVTLTSIVHRANQPRGDGKPRPLIESLKPFEEKTIGSYIHFNRSGFYAGQSRHFSADTAGACRKCHWSNSDGVRNNISTMLISSVDSSSTFSQLWLTPINVTFWPSEVMSPSVLICESRRTHLTHGSTSEFPQVVYQKLK